MAQLSKDAFGRGGKPATIEEIAVLIAQRMPVVADVETVALIDADGRVLAQDLAAPLDLPGFDNSAVDGYAVTHSDLSATGETIFSVTSRVAAGEAPPGFRLNDAAVRIFTGAPMPPGADTVFMQEDVRVLDGSRVALPAGLAKGSNARLRGEDISKGAIAIKARQRLDPRHIALAAALGQTHLSVRRALRVAVFSTGDEIASPGDVLPPASAYDANRHALIALLRRRGCVVSDLGILRDDPSLIAARLEDAAARHDLVVTSGGVSAGEEDHVRAVIEASGSLVFWQLAIKPGRPVAMGVLDGTPIVGLPGNPVAVFIAFAFVVRPLLAALGGASHESIVATSVRSGFDYRKKVGRREFVRVSLTNETDGALTARKYPIDGAGVLTSLTQTDGLVVLPEVTESVRVGERVHFIAYGLLL
jgi:molybdopterin molybdotransferase